MGTEFVGDHLSMGTKFYGDCLSRGINFTGIFRHLYTCPELLLSLPKIADMLQISEKNQIVNSKNNHCAKCRIVLLSGVVSR